MMVQREAQGKRVGHLARESITIERAESRANFLRLPFREDFPVGRHPFEERAPEGGIADAVGLLQQVGVRRGEDGAGASPSAVERRIR